MNNLKLNFSGTDLSRLRVLVEAVGKEISAVAGSVTPNASPAPSNALDMTWSHLVEMLDLGNEPEMRTCPNCRSLRMAGASRCGNCWASLPAIAHKQTITAETTDSHGGRRQPSGNP